MTLPKNFVKQTYDRPNQKGYATADTYFLERVLEIIDEYKINRIVECGTFEGRSTTELSFLVDEIIGIEIKEEYVRKTIDRLTDNSRSNFEIINGSSPQVLSELTTTLDFSNTIFFLDAHVSAAGVGGVADSYWPINDEIKVIPKNKGIIMVHDIYVPGWGDLGIHDSNRLGYDTYVVNGVKQRFDYEFIKDSLTDWSPIHRIEYNRGDKSSGDSRGIGIIFNN